MSRKLKDISEQLEWVLLTKNLQDTLDKEVTSAYVSDLLSDVLANASAGAILITLQTHINVIAVAVHAELSAVIFVKNRMPEKNVIEKAEQEKIALFSSGDSAFEIAGKLYQLGLRG